MPNKAVGAPLIPNCGGGICVSLTASINFVKPGDVISYVVSAASQLTSNASFRIVMPVPDHLTAKPHAGFSCSAPLASGDCPSGAVLTQNWAYTKAQKPHTYALAMRLDSGASAPVDGTVIAAAATVEVQYVTSVSATADVQVNVAGGLTLSASADVVGVVAGQSITYTLAFGNRRSSALTGVYLHAVIPASTTLQSTDGSVIGNDIEWNLATLAAGAYGERQFTVQVNDSTSTGTLFMMQADLRDSSGSKAEIGSANFVAPNNLSVSLTASPDPVEPGGLVTYVVSAASQLTSNASFRIVMPVPDHMTAKPHAGFSCSAPLASGDCPSGAVLIQGWNYHQAQKSHAYAFAMRLDSGASAPVDGTLIAAAATVEVQYVTSVSVTTNTKVNASAGLALTTSADVVGIEAGQAVTYTLTYGNRGNSKLTGVYLRAEVPDATVLQSTGGGTSSGDHIEWNLGTLLPGSHGEREFTVKVDDLTPPGTLFLMRASLRDSSGRVAGAASADIVAPNNISVSLTASPDPVAPGGLATYVVSAASQLTSNASFRIVMPVPDHMTAKAGYNPDFTCSVSLLSGDCPSGAVLTESWKRRSAGQSTSQNLALRMDSDASTLPNGTVISAAATVEVQNVTSVTAQAGSRVQGTIPCLEVSPTGSYTFPNIPVGTVRDKAYTVKNSCTGTLWGEAITSAPFIILSGSPYSLNSGLSQNLVVRFNPTTAGIFSGQVNFSSNGGNTTRFLTGTGDADTDGDGISDWYEDQYGLNKNNPADAQLDPDGDSLTNLEEFNAGRNPIVNEAVALTPVLSFPENSRYVQGSKPAGSLLLEILPVIVKP